MDVKIKCPKTGQSVATGISVGSPQQLETMTMTGNSFTCPACGEQHTWDGKDAFVE